MQSSRKIPQGQIADFISTSTQNALNLKANILNPSFSGTVKLLSNVPNGLLTINNVNSIVSLSGTVNSITKWNSSGTLSNSNITDTGVLITLGSVTTVSGNLTATNIIKSGGLGSQYLMADGTVTTFTSTSGITGSGATNYIPKFTSNSGLTNSQIFDNGSNVLVGTLTDIGHKLQVNGSITSNGIIYSNSYSNYSVNYIQYLISGVEGMRLTSNNALLINTLTDNGTDKLQVNGSINSTDSISTGFKQYYLKSNGITLTQNAGSTWVRLFSTESQFLNAKVECNMSSNNSVNGLTIDIRGGFYDSTTFIYRPLIEVTQQSYNERLQEVMVLTESGAFVVYIKVRTNDFNVGISWTLINTSPNAPFVSNTVATPASTTGSFVLPANGYVKANNYGFTQSNTNNIGIGTQTAITRTHIDKSTQTIGATIPSGALILTDLGGSNLALELGVNTVSGNWIQSRNAVTAAFYPLLLNPTSGNVLIGTVGDNVTDKLQINGSLIATAIKKSGGTSNQYLMADGSVSVASGGGGGIGGSGTVNFVSKFFSSTALTNSQIFDNGSNVGIGTTTPYEKLEVNGAISATGGFIGDPAQGAVTTIFYNPSGYGGIQAVDWGFEYKPLTLNVNGGNVLVGTSTQTGNPNHRLQVNGDIYTTGGFKQITDGSFGALFSFRSTAPGSNYGVFVQADGSALAYMGDANGSAAGGGTVDDFAINAPNGEIWNVSNGHQRFFPSGTERMRLNSNGNLLINTTTDNGIEKLQVNGNTRIIGFTKYNAGLTNASTRPTVTSTRISGEIAGVSNTNDLADDGFVRISSGGGTNANTKTFIDLSAFSTIPDMDKNIIFGTSGLEKMRIDSAGNVSIGTISNTGKLTVSGTNANTIVTNTSSVANNIFLQINSVNKGIIQIDTNNNKMTVGTFTNSDFDIITNTVSKFRIKDTTGNIIIGTSLTDNVTDKLQVEGSIIGTAIKKTGGLGTQYLMADGTVTVSAATGIGGAGHPNYLPKFITTNSVSDSQVFDNGTNVLVATTNDNGVDKLQVNGSFIAASVRVSGGTSSQFLKANGSIDSTVYASDSNVLHTTGTETKTGRLIINSPLNAGLTSTSPNSEGVISICQSALGVGFTAQNTAGGDIAQFTQNGGTVMTKIDYSGRVTSKAVTVNNTTSSTGVIINQSGGGNNILSTNSATDNALFINTSSAGLNSAAVYGEVNSSSNINYCFQGVANGTKGRILMGYTTSSLDEMLWLANQGTGVHAPVIRSEHGKGEGVHIEATDSGESLVINHSAGASGNALKYSKNGSNKVILQDNGRLFLNTPFELSNFHLVQITTNSEHSGGILVYDNTSVGQPNAPLFAGYVNNMDDNNPGNAFYAQMGNNNQGTGFRVDGNLSTRATPFIYNFGGFPKFVVTSAGTVSATSFAVNYGTNTQTQLADGNLLTLVASAYTPTFTGLSNVGTPTSVSCTYIQVGKIVTGRISFIISDTASSTPSQLNFSTPVGHVISGSASLGSGSKISNGGGANFSVIVLQNTSTTIKLYWYAATSGSGGLAATFQYTLV